MARWTGRAAVARLNLEANTRALVDARRRRERGRGRRPTAQQLERLARRQGLADQSYAAAVARLEVLVTRARALMPDPGAILAAMGRGDG